MLPFRDIEPTEVLQMVQLIIEKGDITHYEYRYGVKPERIEPLFRLEDSSENLDSVEDKVSSIMLLDV